MISTDGRAHALTLSLALRASLVRQDPRERPSSAEVVKTTEILIREELKRLEDRDVASSCDDASSVFGRWSSVELSSAGTGAGLSRNLD